jgi:hypothetical protein
MVLRYLFIFVQELTKTFMKTFKRVKKQCNQCEALVINGMFCHEHGCPNEYKKWDNETEEWKSVIECPECGCDVEEGETCCNIY